MNAIKIKEKIFKEEKYEIHTTKKKRGFKEK